MAAAQAAAFAGSAFLSAYHDFSAWGAALLISGLVLIAVVIRRPPQLGPAGALALAGLGLLLGWSALSMLWAPSVALAWTETNRAGLYVLTLALAIASVAAKRGAEAVIGVLAAAGAVVAVYLTGRLLGGSGPELFAGFRLDQPIGYAGGQAAFLLMAFWPLIALAERPSRGGTPPPATRRVAPVGRGAALALATLLAELLVLTQSRTVLPAVIGSAAVLLALAPGRTVRALALVVVGAAVTASLPWLLDVYAQKGEVAQAAPTEHVASSAGIAMLTTALAAGVAWGGVTWLAARSRLPAGRSRSAAVDRPETARQETGGPRASRRAVAAAVAAAVAGGAAVAIAIGGDGVERVREEYRQFVELRPEPDRSQRFTSGAGNRYDLWRVAARQFRDRPLEGVGAGNYIATYYRERRTDAEARSPHSLPLQTLGELGLVGFGGIALFAAGVFRGAFAGAFGGASRQLSERERWPQVAAAGAFTGWLIQASVDWLYGLPGVTATAILCAAVLVSDPRRAGSSRGRPRPPRAAIALAVVLVAAVAASAGIQYAADRYRERAADALATDPAEAREEASRSLRLNPANMEARYVEAASYARENDYPGTRRALIEAARRERFNYVPWKLLGDAATRRGDRAGAARAYTRASRLNPRDAGLRRLARQHTTVSARGATE